MTEQVRYVLCIRNEGYPASLELYKIYRAIPDERAAQDQLFRVVDESGEDYLYPIDCFQPIKSPTSIEELDDTEDLAVAADFLKRRRDVSSPGEMGYQRWEEVADEWDGDEELED